MSFLWTTVSLPSPRLMTRAAYGSWLSTRVTERGEERLDVVAARSGLGSAANLRARVRRETGLSPSAYRRRFGPAAGEAVTA